jgi:hypothetical protein
MTGKTRYISFALLAALLALTSCRDLTLEPVFYALSQEIPLGDDKGFPDAASVFRMVEFNDGSDDYYLAAAGSLYIRGVLPPADNWTKVAPPPTLDNAMCNTLALFGTTIYAGFYNSSSGTGYGLYTAPLTLPLTLVPATDTDVQDADVQITMIKAAGGQLFVATNTGDNVNTLYYGDGTVFNPVTGVPATAGFIDVESFGGSYWILAGASLYSAAALPGPFAVYIAGTGSPPVSPLSEAPVSGGLFNDGPALFVSAGNGHLYRTGGGDIWTKTATAFLDDNEEFATRFTAFAAPGDDAGAVYVGTQGQGYIRIPSGDVTGGSGTLTREPAYNITALYNGSLNCLFYDAANHRLFLGTNRAGLWRGDWVSGSVWTWRQE